MLLVPLLAALLVRHSPGTAQQASQEDASAVTASAEGRDLAQLAERDRRVAFTAESAIRARRALDSGPMSPQDRAMALYALGAAGAGSELPRLQSAAADGGPEERGAALFALAELGADGWPALHEALTRPDPDVDGPAVLALLQAELKGATRAHAVLGELADGAGPRAPLARAALGGGDAASGLDGARGSFFELRWGAGQHYGLVDGKRWQSLLLDALLADDTFLDEVILASARELEPGALRLHLFELLQSGERTGVLRAAATYVPGELARLCRADEWRPGSPEAWRTVLDAIDAARNEREAKELLEIAFRTVPEMNALSGLLLVRAGGDLPWKWLAEQITGGTPELRSRLVEACGDRKDMEIVPELADLLEKYPDFGLLGEGVVALARLGHPPALTMLQNQVKATASPERQQVLMALARAGHDPRMHRPIEDALRLTDLEPDVALELEIALGLAGELRGHARLRLALLADPHGPDRIRLARAILKRPEAADLELLRALFPVEDDRELNVELAESIVRLREPGAMTLLRGALWNDSWNRSVLAGGLMVRVSGLEVLIDELDTAPRTATDRDLRRVGFAIGEWGGLSAVEKLARERRETDPGLQGALLGALAARDQPGK